MWVQVNGNQGYVYFTLFLLTVKFKSMYVLIWIQNEWVEEMLRGTTGPDIKNTEKSTFPKIWDLDLRLRDGLGESKALVIKAVFAPVLLTVKIKKMLVFDRRSSFFTNSHQNGVCSMWGYRWEFRNPIQSKKIVSEALLAWIPGIPKKVSFPSCELQRFGSSCVLTYLERS